MADNSDIAQRRALARTTDEPEYRVRREELIKAAARVFSRKGLRAAKLDDIAREFGKDRASLYYYTSGKEELFQEVVAEAVLSNVTMVEQLHCEEMLSAEKLRCLITRLMESYEIHYPYLFVYVQEPMLHLDESTEWKRKMSLLQRRFDEGVRGIIRQGIDDGSLDLASHEVRLIANAIIGMCSWSHRWLKPGKATSGTQIGQVFADMVLNGVVKHAVPRG